MTLRLGEVAELASNSASLREFSASLLAAWGRHVGFDVAMHATEHGVHAAVGVSPRDLEKMAANNDAYARELMPVKRAALAQRGVAIDSQVLTSRRGLRYYVEVMAPEGGEHALLALGTMGGRIVSMSTLGRTGSCFSRADVAAIEAVLPVVALGTAALERAAPRDGGLRARERELVDYVALGLTNAQIASALGLSPRTVRNQLSRLYAKLGVAGRAEMIARLR
ncbi:MAG: helix-turn-helix transcriptional regulator [Labilithrix sp.]|nr:helix-turn-helix transcriptional regulator [Labilithrix sp.]